MGHTIIFVPRVVQTIYPLNVRTYYQDQVLVSSQRLNGVSELSAHEWLIISGIIYVTKDSIEAFIIVIGSVCTRRRFARADGWREALGIRARLNEGAGAQPRHWR